MDNKNTTSKILKGSAGGIIIRILTRGSSLISSIILARFLSPKDFGLVAYGLLVISFLTVFTEFGIKLTLIQLKEDITSFLGTAFTINSFRGLVISTLMFLSANNIAVFFDEQQLSSLIRYMSIIPFLKGIVNINMVVLEKNINMKKVYIVEGIGSLIGLLFGVITAIVLQNYFALIVAQVSTAFIILIGSYTVVPSTIIKFELKKEKLLILSNYGKWYLGNSLLYFFFNEIDKVIIGKIFPSAQLGYYTMANKLTTVPINETTQSIGRVMFPAYSIYSDDEIYLKKLFLSNIYTITAVTSGISFFVIILSSEMVPLLLGNQWSDSIILFQLIGTAMIFNSIMAAGKGLLNGIGKPKLLTITSTIKALLVVFFIIILIKKLGINGVAYSLIFANAITLVVWALIITNIIKIKIKEWIVTLSPLFLSGFLCYLIANISENLFDSEFHAIVKLSLVFTTYFLSFIIFSKLLKIHTYQKLEKKILSFYKKR